MDRSLFEESLGLLSPSFGSPRSIVPLPDAPPDVTAPGYAELWRSALLPNSPRLLPAPLSAAWGSRRRWVTPIGKPDLAALRRDFGDAPVPVADCSEREYNANPKTQMPMREFLSYWQDAMSRDGCPPSLPGLYLKDWHMPREFPGHDAYATPECFASDWLNEYCDAVHSDDYRFVYMGPRGSWTPFHADVFRSYSWSANVCGRKLWLLYPPGREEALRDRLGNLPYDVAAFDPPPAPAKDVAAEKSEPRDTAGKETGAALRKRRGNEPIEVIQEAGEIIFVPSGWHHQVHNLEDTISINHNWLNGCNVDLVWSFLQSELRAVQREIGHCRSGMSDWAEQCQRVMKACTGIDYGEFYAFMKLIADRRVEFLHERGDIPPGSSRADKITDHSHGDLARLGDWHAAFDLARVQEVVVAMQGDPDFGVLPVDCLPIRPEQLRKDIEHALGNMGRN
ncbi:2-oxoglutarate and iron-dependent oxygenase JMJD4 [Lampetra fluviatilis]